MFRKCSKHLARFQRYTGSGHSRGCRYSSILSCKHPKNLQEGVEEREILVSSALSGIRFVPPPQGSGLGLSPSQQSSGLGLSPSQQSSSCSRGHLSKHLAFFEGLNIDADGLCKIICAYPQALILDPDTELKVSITHLEAAVGRSILRECILAWPSLLGLGFPLESAQKLHLGTLNQGGDPLPGLGFVQHGLRFFQKGLGSVSPKDDARLQAGVEFSSKEAEIDSRSSKGDLGSVRQGSGLPQREFSGKVDFLLKCGFKRNTKLLAKALYCALHKSTQDVDAIVRALTSLGLSRNQAGRLIKLQPPILQQRPVEIAPKLDYILNTLNFSIEDLLKYASFMLYDLDTHIRPRYLMHGWIKSKRLLRRNFKLDYIMSMSEKQFLSKFVECHEGGVSMYNKFIKNGK